VQAAWVVLVKPPRWERHIKAWIAAQSADTMVFWRSHCRTSSPVA
jgi:hypothetical protein